MFRSKKKKFVCVFDRVAPKTSFFTIAILRFLRQRGRIHTFLGATGGWWLEGTSPGPHLDLTWTQPGPNLDPMVPSGLVAGFKLVLKEKAKRIFFVRWLVVWWSGFKLVLKEKERGWGARVATRAAWGGPAKKLNPSRTECMFRSRTTKNRVCF